MSEISHKQRERLAGEPRLGPCEGAKSRSGASHGTGLGGEGVILWHFGR